MKLTNSKLIIHGSTLLLVISLFLILNLIVSCDTTEPPPSNYKITLESEDASCTETWVNLKIDKSITLPIEIEFKQNDSTIITTNINSNDTTLFVENLLPSQTYSFKISSIQKQVSSNKVTVTTLDTTSHNFIWEEHNFEEYGISYLML